MYLYIWAVWEDADAFMPNAEDDSTDQGDSAAPSITTEAETAAAAPPAASMDSVADRKFQLQGRAFQCAIIY